MIGHIPSESFWNLKSQVLLKDTQYEGYDKKKAIEAEIFKGMDKYINSDGTVKTANAHSIQANDNATQIVNVENSSDTKAKLALKIEDLKAEKQKWIDDCLWIYFF